MIENKRELCHAGTGEETDLDIRMDAARSFGWTVDSVTPYDRKNAFVISCSRDTEMKNYVQIKQLEDEYLRKNEKLSIAHTSVLRSKGNKIKDLRIFPTVLKVLSFIGAVFFFMLGTSESSMFVVGGCFALFFVLLIFLSKRKKAEVRKKYDELDSIKMKAKTLL